MNGRKLCFLLTVAVAVNGQAPATFPTPEAAVAALVRAVQSDKPNSVASVVGPEMRDALKPVDPDLGKLEKELFLDGAKRSIKIERDGDNRAIAYFGTQEWPFPAPLVKEGQTWHFDGPAGVKEVQDRHIGRDELAAVELCRAYVIAQLEYSSEDHDDDGVLEYAQKGVSTPGKQDGLYWSNDAGQAASPLGPLFAEATAAAAKGEALSGYMFKLLTRQGANAKGGARNYIADGHMVFGFALVAWPAEYGKSGISTFIVNQLGEVYEKDLGASTAATASGMTEFNPDSTWSKVED